MGYVFEQATPSDAEQVFALTEKRVRWMDHSGIRQWNVTNYLKAYPAAYYESMQSRGNLYVLRDARFRTIGAVVLLQEDKRWPDRADTSAFYIHNLVTDSEVKGAGGIILREIERLAVRQKKECLRLDCAADNVFLNKYYESHGYRMAGHCEEGLYIGNRREKKINSLERCGGK